MTERLYIVSTSETTRKKAGRAGARPVSGGGRMPDLRSGDYVSVRVVKHLSGRKWAVALGGRLFPAVAEMRLKPGRSFTAWVERFGGRVVLHTDEPRIDSLTARLQEQTGLKDPVSELVISALLRSRMAVTAELVSRLSHLFTAFRRKHKVQGRLADVRLARALVLLTEKGIDPESTGAEEILRTLVYLHDEQRRGSRDGRSRQDHRQNDQVIKEDITERDESERTPLQLFNHLKGKEGSWVVIPFRYTVEEHAFRGSLRLLVDHLGGDAKRAVLEVVDQDGEVFCFLFRRGPGGLHMSGYASPEGARARVHSRAALLHRLMRKHGVTCEDSVHDAASFDGFSPVEELWFPRVDTYT